MMKIALIITYLMIVIAIEVVKLYHSDFNENWTFALVSLWRVKTLNWFGKLLFSIGYLILFPISFIFSILGILGKIGTNRKEVKDND